MTANNTAAAHDSATPPGLAMGVAYASAAYVGWGFFPLFFKQLAGVSALEILAHRILWAVPAVLLLIWIMDRGRAVAQVLADRRAVVMLAGSAAILSVNWVVFVWAINAERVLEASLGYYINPLVTVGLGLLFLGERLRPAQGVAVSLASAGVLTMVIVGGQLPLVSLVLAATFAVYGLMRKTVAADSRSGLLVETALMAPLALAYAVWLGVQGQASFGNDGLSLTLWLIACGPMTAGPLVLFAMGARRLQLATLGLLQYIAPTLQFATALAYGEAFTLAHAVTFGLIWLGLIVFSVDGLRAEARRRQAIA